MIEVGEIGRRSFSSSLCQQTSSFRSGSTTAEEDDDVDVASLWESIERLPTFERLRSSLFVGGGGGGEVEEKLGGRRVVDVTKLGDEERHLFIQKLINNIENDNLKLLRKVRERIHKVGVKFPSVEVKYKNVNIEAKCEVVRGKALPTLWNSLRTKLFDIIKFCGAKSREAKINIIEDVSGVIKPGRLTLLLGPPGCGKTTLLKALSGNHDKSLKMTGEICYNGHKLEEIVPQKICAYISQYDLHIPEMTVRETLDFSARCQGIGDRADMMKEICKREKEQGIIPDPDVDTYMKAISVEGLRQTLQTDYILKILGLDICADTLVGDAMRRGISGGQKKRLNTGEMMVGPYRGLFMDEITNGLDSSTAFQIVSCLQHLAHFTNATILVSLLQPAPETFELFDDLILMAQKKIVYEGRRDRVLEFFEHCGFKCPKRKGVADFLQEVISRKDQPQFWYPNEQIPYSYVSVEEFCRKFKCYNNVEKKLVDEEAISIKLPNFQKSKSCQEINEVASTSKWEVFKACASRELLLMKRNSFLYVFKTCELFIIGLMTMTVFIRSRMEVDVEDGNYYMGALFFALILLLVDGFPELVMTIERLEVFYKQKEFNFYPAWAYAIPAAILKIPLSLLESLVWTSLTYYVIGFTPQPIRFCQQFILLFGVHLSALSMFRMIASIFQTNAASITVGNFAILFALLFGGFIISHTSMPAWLEWGFWVSPISYGEIGLSVNEFLAPRWQKVQAMNTTIGHEVLQSRGLDYPQSLYWISLAALFGFALIFNIGFVLALTFLNPPGSCRAIISYEKLSQSKNSEECNGGANSVEQPRSFKTVIETTKGRIALPFTPLTVVFQDLQYHVDMPLEMKEKGFTQKKLQLLNDITGALRPGVLTGLMGVSGAGKTTLLDVLAGRKTSGYIEGEIKIGGFPKVQETFARISGYCEQTDIHSPQITVEESLIFSASLRLASDIDWNTKALILLKTGGQMIYCGPLGQCSRKVIEYFEHVPGVSKIRENYNPATWMLEVTSPSAEAELGLDFAQVYKNSSLYKNNKELVKQLSSPPPGSKDLHFSNVFSQSFVEQFKACFWKQNLSYWRSPSYNLLRFVRTAVASFIFGILFWKQGKEIENQQNLFNVFGSMYTAIIFLGIDNCGSVLPYVSMERTVMYRERFAGMYSSWAYSLAQVIVEVPYIFIQAAANVFITYPMIGFYGSASKVFWYFYSMLCALLYYNYLGMLLVSITPNFYTANILSSAFYTIFNLFSGFLVPNPQIPKWWKWMYYITPTSWTLNSLLTSQYGDLDNTLIVFKEKTTVSAFLTDYFGFHHTQLPLVGVILILFPLVFALLFGFFIGKLSFQKR
ncbi:pleiotropic drug resistance protein 3-like isoform X2 [Benincasa hispida]|uniref:pleiotropic drug resistance protein 3-like isoform X2 n=1 Tax=Benincasa hispida TaxID=102211 RepID=UPI001900E1F8|nr:pleiotropic drug resistance protein 3-like isoform X2 [Benincasa hispida]